MPEDVAGEKTGSSSIGQPKLEHCLQRSTTAETILVACPVFSIGWDSAVGVSNIAVGGTLIAVGS